MEIWEVLKSSEDWCKDVTARAVDGTVVEPHDPHARSFSIVGALVKCYVPIGKLWSPTYEIKRTAVFNAIASNTALRKHMQQSVKCRSMKYIQLGALNNKVDFNFVQQVLDRMKAEKKES